MDGPTTGRAQCGGVTVTVEKGSANNQVTALRTVTVT